MRPPPNWSDLPFFKSDWPALQARLAQEDWLPGPNRVFAALELCDPDDVRVIILGQDPYPTPGHANGLAFSVTPETPLPRSLANIYKEMRADMGGAPETGDLSHLARQGVLLLNTSLSVPPGQAGAHAKWGWDKLVHQVIERAMQSGPLAFILWGAFAQRVVKGLPRPEDFVLTSAHPSPLSASRGFVGSRPFSRVNDWLCQKGEAPIDWTGLSHTSFQS